MALAKAAGLASENPLHRMSRMTRKHLHHYNIPDHAHELTFSCWQKQPLLGKDRSRQWLIQAMANARQRRGVALLAFVIMPEHVHMIVRPLDERYDVAWYLKSIKQSVSRRAVNWLKIHDPQWYQRQCDASGGFRFWQPGGGYDRNINTPGTLLKMIEYIHHNPVRRGLVEKAENWKWSSAGWYADGQGILAMDALQW